MARILVIEDSLTTQALIQSCLDDLSEVVCVSSLNEAERQLRQGPFDLLLLDVVLPDGDGFEFCERLRDRAEYAHLPLIFLTGKTQLDDRVRGLRLGGDDYIGKPFEPDELRARVEARLRRRSGDSLPSLKGFRVDLDGQAVYFQDSAGGTEKNLELTRIEFKLLLIFMRHLDRFFSRAELLKKAWGDNTHVSDHTVDTHISSLRKKIAACPYQIKSVVKRGYRLEPLDPR